MDHMIYAHGGRYSKTGMITIPRGVTVAFFVYDGEELIDSPLEGSNTWGIYSRLLSGLNLPANRHYIDDRIVERLTSKQQVHNYSCWSMQDIGHQEYSGIYQVGGAKIHDMQNEMTMQQIFNNIQIPTTIYWVACRTID